MSSPPSLPLAPSSTEAPADEELPPLETHVAITPADQIAGLKLVADSVAQQRQLAARILLYHPLHGALFAALLAGLWHLMYKTRGDIPLIFTTGAGVAMAVLVGARAATAGYIYAAEAVGREWLGEDVVLVTKFGGDVIGSLILGWERGEGRGNRRRKGGRGVVRGWTTKLRYRGKGVGVALLEEAVRIVAEKGGEEIVFDDKHANSKRVLPAMYNAPFDRKEAAYRAVLEDVAAVGLGGGKKR
ncbi:hypothetical protein EJ06DRAFT_539874 [Trichodelitschia bisporula]|uniref:N-acetyltransferase domain-containing protein n=1 Tax=Trichodelitschia bisporula TaxID=703511 RepID=A0A6G1HL84_9PEZI|nr:hypothetical protein EJ06DRAFT_539874 [Trichodelitschia bisporula]